MADAVLVEAVRLLEAKRAEIDQAIRALQVLMDGRLSTERATVNVEELVRTPARVPPQRRPRVEPSDTPDRITTRGEQLKDIVFTWLMANGPANTKAIARALNHRVAPVRAALYQLEADRKIHTSGVKRSQRWGLGPKVPLAKPPTPARDTALREAQGAATRPPDQTKVEEAVRAARRYGHTLGPFKSSSPGAGSQWIARCGPCDTYVTIGRDGKIAGPGTRHDCLAAGASS